MTAQDKQSHGAERIYSSTPRAEIPWNSERPPELLVELVEKGRVKSGRALDLGCGLGNYAIWLAGKGFEVVGVDAAPTAMKTAKQKAREKGVKCRFLVADLRGKWPDLGGRFDFIYDWGLLHHIMPDYRERYVSRVHNASKPGGHYASLCFNRKDTSFEGVGKYRRTTLGTIVYLSSERELRQLFKPFFKIIEFRVFESEGKKTKPVSVRWQGGHVFNFCFMEHPVK